MPDDGPGPDDIGGEAPCLAHLVDDGSEPLGPGSWADLVDRLADGVVGADAAGVITYWNDAATRIFGWSATEAVGQNLDLIIPERLRRRHWAGWHHAVATGQVREDRTLLEVPALHKEGRPLSIAFTITLVTDALGSVSRLVAVVRDDTARWQERKDLRQELARLRPDGPDTPS